MILIVGKIIGIIAISAAIIAVAKFIAKRGEGFVVYIDNYFYRLDRKEESIRDMDVEISASGFLIPKAEMPSPLDALIGIPFPGHESDEYLKTNRKERERFHDCFYKTKGTT